MFRATAIAAVLVLALAGCGPSMQDMQEMVAAEVTDQMATLPTAVPGPPGLQGEPGPQGVAGPQGLTGPQGAQGLTGAVGPQGVAGEQGRQGPPGPVGVQGPMGPIADTKELNALIAALCNLDKRMASQFNTSVGVRVYLQAGTYNAAHLALIQDRESGLPTETYQQWGGQCAINRDGDLVITPVSTTWTVLPGAGQ